MRRTVPAAVLLSLGLLSACSPSPAAPAGGSDRAPGKAADSAAAAPPAASPAAPSTTAGDPSKLTIAFAGDVHFEGRTAARLGVQPPEQALGPISATLSAADLAVLNLESAITDRGAPEAKIYHFRTSPQALTALQSSGVDVVSLANNHAVDYGPDGLTDTLAAKAASPIPVIGLGRNASEAYAPHITTVKGTKVAVLAASQIVDLTNQKYRAGSNKPGIASALDETALLHAVTQAKAQAPVVLVYLHWGDEGKACPTAAQSGLAKKLAKAGATAVVGTHAHTMLGAGMLGDTYVGYGFGNFLWYGTSDYAGSDESGVTTLTVSPQGKVTGETFTPAHLDGRGVPVPQTGADATAAQARRDGLRACTGLAAVPSH